MISVIEWKEIELRKKLFLFNQSKDKFNYAKNQVNCTQLSRKQSKNKAKIELEKAIIEMNNARKNYNESYYKLEMLKISLS